MSLRAALASPAFDFADERLEDGQLSAALDRARDKVNDLLTAVERILMIASVGPQRTLTMQHTTTMAQFRAPLLAPLTVAHRLQPRHYQDHKRSTLAITSVVELLFIPYQQLSFAAAIAGLRNLPVELFDGVCYITPICSFSHAHNTLAVAAGRPRTSIRQDEKAPCCKGISSRSYNNLPFWPTAISAHITSSRTASTPLVRISHPPFCNPLLLTLMSSHVSDTEPTALVQDPNPAPGPQNPAAASANPGDLQFKPKVIEEMSPLMAEISFDKFMHTFLPNGIDLTDEELEEVGDFTVLCKLFETPESESGQGKRSDPKEEQMFPIFCDIVNKVLSVKNTEFTYRDTSGYFESPDIDIAPDGCIYPVHERAKSAWTLTDEDIQRSRRRTKNPNAARTSFAFAEVVWDFRRAVDKSAFQIPPSKQWFLRSTQRRGREAIHQISKCASEILLRQHRTHLFMVYITRTHARVIRWDRAAAVVSEAVDLKTSAKSFLNFVSRVATMSPKDRGHDPTVQLASADEVNALRDYEKKSTNIYATQMVKKILENERFYPIYRVSCQSVDTPGHTMDFLIGRECSGTDSPTGRATKGFVAYRLANKNLVFLKDFWRPDAKSAVSELDTYERLKKAEVPYVATAIAGGDVGGSGAQRTINQDQFVGPRRPSKRIHHRIVLLQVGRHLETYTYSVEMIIVVYQALYAHRQAWEKAESPIYEPHGFLCDWDLCRDANYDGEAAQDGRCGTWPFLSALLLKYPLKPNQLSDDLESFVHVVAWLALRFHEHEYTPEYASNLESDVITANEDNDELRDFKAYYFDWRGKKQGHDIGGRHKMGQINSGRLDVQFTNTRSPLAKLIKRLFLLLQQHYQAVNFAALEVYNLKVRGQSKKPLPPSNLKAFAFKFTGPAADELNAYQSDFDTVRHSTQASASSVLQGGVPNGSQATRFAPSRDVASSLSRAMADASSQSSSSSGTQAQAKTPLPLDNHQAIDDIFFKVLKSALKRGQAQDKTLDQFLGLLQLNVVPAKGRSGSVSSSIASSTTASSYYHDEPAVDKSHETLGTSSATGNDSALPMSSGTDNTTLQAQFASDNAATLLRGTSYHTGLEPGDRESDLEYKAGTSHRYLTSTMDELEATGTDLGGYVSDDFCDSPGAGSSTARGMLRRSVTRAPSVASLCGLEDEPSEALVATRKRGGKKRKGAADLDDAGGGKRPNTQHDRYIPYQIISTRIGVTLFRIMLDSEMWDILDKQIRQPVQTRAVSEHASAYDRNLQMGAYTAIRTVASSSRTTTKALLGQPLLSSNDHGMAGFYTGLALAFRSASGRPGIISSRSLLSRNIPCARFFALRGYTGGTCGYVTRHILPSLIKQPGLALPHLSYGQCATFATFPEFPSARREVVYKKAKFDYAGEMEKRQRVREIRRRRRTSTIEERLEARAKRGGMDAKTWALRKTARKERKRNARRILYWHRKTWTWREMRRRFRTIPHELKLRILPWNRRRRLAISSRILMREAYRRKFYPIEHRIARKPISISTLDPEKLKHSDYITLPWSNSCWITTEMLLPQRKDLTGNFDDDEDFLEDWSSDQVGVQNAGTFMASKSPVGLPTEQAASEGDAVENSQEGSAENLARYTYRRWEIPRFAQELGHPADATDPESLLKVPFPPYQKRPGFAPRRWDVPYFVQGRGELRKDRAQTRIQNKKFRKNVLGIKKRPLFYYYKFRYPPSLFEPRGGFLYLYKPPPGLPDSAVGLRFRITNDHDPKSFVFGRDLTFQGVPWTVPLHYGAIRNPVIRRLLFKDELLPIETIRRCGALRRRTVRTYTVESRTYQRVRRARIKARKRRRKGTPSPIPTPYELHRDTNPYLPTIYALGQPFRLDFSRRNMRFFIVQAKGGKEECYRFELRLPKRNVGLGEKPQAIVLWEEKQAQKVAERDEVGAYADAEEDAEAYEHSSYAHEELTDWRDYVSANRPEPEIPSKSTSERSSHPFEGDESYKNEPKQTPYTGRARPNVLTSPIYSGSAIVCLEALTLEQPAGIRVIVVRILRVIDPIVPDPEIESSTAVPEIKQGSLLPYINPVTLNAAPWYWPRPNKVVDPMTDTLMSLPVLSQQTWM
ncbi:hypothetical protein NM688_g624 [Phlebia brevispora]|uniref:Uncharacterized protein n=1 Tax=Phlebia brevispora TaxID=194682 RepID=A0ACC1TDG6_9APHY|nr:hypothetical protein NM688_g624 [Phlebia brevispora]